MTVTQDQSTYDVIQLNEGPDGGPNLFKVATGTDVIPLAEAITQSLKARESIVLRAIGAGCVNIMYKGLAEAAKRLAGGAVPVKLLIDPSFATVDGDKGSPITAMEAVPVYLVQRHGG